MDPFSMAIAALVLVHFFRNLPEMLWETSFAVRGEESPKARARRQRLTGAGIDPATGGAARQYLGNLWRDKWLDAEARRLSKRAARGTETPGPDGPSARSRLRSRFDEAVSDKVRGWRGKPADEHRRPADSEGKTAGDDEVDLRPQVDLEDPTTIPPPTGEAPAPQADETAQLPIRVTSTVGDPIPELGTKPALTRNEGEAMTQAVARGGEVTGVVSGAAEARAIQRAIETANAQYIAAMAKIRQRIHSLGDQVLNTVQFGTHSDVVRHLVGAAESAAAASAQAKSCGAETSPLMGAVARAFDRRNS